MGRRDFRWRESKKAKKDAKKRSGAEPLPPVVTVEIIKRGRKRPAEEE